MRHGDSCLNLPVTAAWAPSALPAPPSALPAAFAEGLRRASANCLYGLRFHCLRFSFRALHCFFMATVATMVFTSPNATPSTAHAAAAALIGTPHSRAASSSLPSAGLHRRSFVGCGCCRDSKQLPSALSSTVSTPLFARSNLKMQTPPRRRRQHECVFDQQREISSNNGSTSSFLGSTKRCGPATVLTDIAREVVHEASKVIDRPRVDPKSVVSVILGGGAGTRLFPLTRRRAKPAVPIGGAYRLVDVPMSNCINSGINKIYVLTQFNSASLNRHLARTYSFGNGVNFGDGFVEVLAATQTPGEMGMNWFQGTADAVRQFMWLFEDAKNQHLRHVLILSGDHLYRMDYMDFIQKHQDTGADITVSCVPIDESRASDYGLMKIDTRGRILYFNEKPKGDNLMSMRVDTSVLGVLSKEAKEKPYIASMGIYVFRIDILLKLLRSRYPTSNDFGSEILPASVKEFNVHSYLFNGYWEDIGTIKSFYDANMALTDEFPKFHFYDATKPIFTSPQYLPPTKIENCQIIDSIVSHGCFLRECSVQHSLVGVRSRLESGSELKDTMMMGADYYETEVEMGALLAEGEVPMGVGENTIIKQAILDKNTRIGCNVVIVNTDGVQEAERPSEGFYIRSGIVVILENAVIKDGTVI